ncbi:HvfC/BufC N-terminal domain-containing protein [Acanthopleuribacter pedis]|uniref:Putative DNA-binding domain-containing protein n=1 Tax=Acanthopleuribacter pedis TaxID=442870 RepID=A0A8J7U7D6_9BACT|nr:DNA-binding domain-containing protein [Acanthopleuribacter pedis]MBO1322889.1 putative DNA-binding domain-containing protein [Acanthopleuribacter pedis]
MKRDDPARIQAWLKTVLVSRGDLAGKLTTAASAHGLALAEVVAGGYGASAERRLDVYAAGYVLRLVACLQEQYPALTAFMGEAMFAVFAKAYVVTHPPDSWRLEHLGRRFPEFLRETRPRQADAAGETFYALPAEIARFEWAKSQALTAPGFEGAAVGVVPGLGPLGYLGEACSVELPDCLRLETLRYDVPTFLAAFGADPKTPLPAARQTHLAVSRVDYRLTVLEVADWAHAFLVACRGGGSVQEAVAASSQATGQKASAIQAYLMLWLPTAIQFGLLRLR